MLLRTIPLSEIKVNFDDRFNVETTDWIPRLNRWVVSAIGHIHSGLLFNPTSSKLQFENNELLMPIDMKVLQGITYKGIRLVPSDINVKLLTSANEVSETYYFLGNATQDKLIVDPQERPIEMKLPTLDYTHLTVNSGVFNRFINTYTIMRDNVIRLNLLETSGEVILYYKSLPYLLNQDGSIELTVPDNENLIEALNWYILLRLIGRGYKHHTFEYQYVANKWEEERKKAKRSISALSIDKQHVISAMFRTFLVDYDRWHKIM